MRKRLSIMGSTGSIGTSALDVVLMHPDLFDIRVLSAATNIDLLARQVRTFRPETVVVLDEIHARRLKDLLNGEPLLEILFGESGYARGASHENVDLVLLAMVGAAGLLPALAAIRAKKEVALANKETLVMAGGLVMALARKNNVAILPVDSEHSAIFQCLAGNRAKDLKKIFLTASGGPFLNTPEEKFTEIRPEHALSHPTWKMGHKISIDSATLMNKGLEIIEAVHLFGLTIDQVEVVVHPQSIVHSMVGFNDGSVMAQMGIPDMRTAIALAFSWPDRLTLDLEFPDFTALGGLEFQRPDMDRFPSIGFAVEACRQGGTLPAVMNGANEIAVQAFLKGRIDFPGIFSMVEKTMTLHRRVDDPALSDIIEADRWARQMALALI
ncbi:MAG: 1-deoxy-D-xylulose-5-phosphate reductoisomerase [Desulfobacterium sp.]|jgi:1-deoxy-D-xylulose-5-phosphate reductoisomerase|nr:1-deoxy-D-xylulose-5-phosphate reductoisomerase [Desulfobacterium sp.]